MCSAHNKKSLKKCVKYMVVVSIENGQLTFILAMEYFMHQAKRLKGGGA